MKSNPFLTLLDPKSPKSRQFTDAGLDILVEYYNQKYPLRGRIERAVEEPRGEDLIQDSLIGNGWAPIFNIAVNLASKIDALPKARPIKVMVSIAGHSIPFVITDRKMIRLRSRDSFDDLSLENEIADKLGLALIESKDSLLGDEKKTSIQGDRLSCHMIALGILKDITPEDLEAIAQFEQGYEIPVKLLKYSQSSLHIKKILGEDGASIILKPKDPPAKSVTLDDYIAQGKRNPEESRIAHKQAEFIALVEEIYDRLQAEAASDSIDLQDFARRILQHKSKVEQVKDGSPPVAATAFTATPLTIGPRQKN